MHTDIDSFKAEDEEGNMATYVDMETLDEDTLSQAGRWMILW